MLSQHVTATCFNVKFRPTEAKEQASYRLYFLNKWAKGDMRMPVYAGSFVSGPKKNQIIFKPQNYTPTN